MPASRTLVLVRIFPIRLLRSDDQPSRTQGRSPANVATATRPTLPTGSQPLTRLSAPGLDGSAGPKRQKIKNIYNTLPFIGSVTSSLSSRCRSPRTAPGFGTGCCCVGRTSGCGCRHAAGRVHAGIRVYDAAVPEDLPSKLRSYERKSSPSSHHSHDGRFRSPLS